DRLLLDIEFKPGSKLSGAQDPQTIFPKCFGRDRPQDFCVEIFKPAKWIEDFARQRIFENRVDCEIAARGRIFDRHRRIAFDDERAMAAAGLAIATRQRDVEMRGDFVNGEGFTDNVDLSESIKYFSESQRIDS